MRLFPDRLEVENPGGLFGPVTVDRLGEPGPLATRNAHLMRLLEDLPAEDGQALCENRGTGITAMLESLRAAGMEPPRFDDRHTLAELVRQDLLRQHGTWRWTFYTLVEGARLPSGNSLKAEERAILEYVRTHGAINRGECESLLGIQANRASYLLQTQRDQGLLRQEGERRWARYVLPNL